MLFLQCKLENEDAQLSKAREIRVQLQSTWQVVSDWLGKADGYDVTDMDVITYETLDGQLQKHKVTSTLLF